MFFNDSFVNIVTYTFTSLIIVELLNVYSVVNKFNWKMLIASAITLIIYVVSIVTFRTYFDVSYINWDFVWKVIVLTFGSWLPLHITKIFIEWIDPPEQKKILASQ